MAEHELVIRNGTVIDGTGADRVVGDVAVSNGVVTAVGRVDGTGKREIDADGHLVAPTPSGSVDHEPGLAYDDSNLSQVGFRCTAIHHTKPPHLTRTVGAR